MNIKFCRYYHSDGQPPTGNKYCRACGDAIACNILWKRVIDLGNSKNGEPVHLIGTNAVLYPNTNNRDIVHLRVNVQWNLPKEDFLYFIATEHAKRGRKNQRTESQTSPSLTQQEPWVNSIVKMLGGWNIPEIVEVRKVQKK